MSTPTAQATVIETASHGEDDARVVRMEVWLTIPPAGALEDYEAAGGSL